jgi:hypothetical protein
MGLTLSSENVVDFLKSHQLCAPDFQPDTPVVSKEGTNFNLVVKLDNVKSLLVKQNRLSGQRNTSRSLSVEWVVQELINNFSSLTPLQPLISKILLLDWSENIVVSVFYDQYVALDQFYETQKGFNPHIARVFGANLAKIHSATYKQQPQREFLERYLQFSEAKQPDFITRLNNLDLSVFGRICNDGLDFYKLYQRYPSLSETITKLYQQTESVCLIHNDLTLDNFIVDPKINFETDSIEIKPEQIKIIDWERINWGDPAVDLGMVVSEYVGGIWLNSLVADSNLDINTMLSMALCPLEKITPSLKAFLEGYLTQFPQILGYRKDFIRRVVQFTGIGILNRLSYYVEHHYPFHNNSICKLQVAKNLLCHPQAGIETIFGETEAELLEYSYQAA